MYRKRSWFVFQVYIHLKVQIETAGVCVRFLCCFRPAFFGFYDLNIRIMFVNVQWLTFLPLAAFISLPFSPEVPLPAVADQMVVNTYIKIDSAEANSFFPSVSHAGLREFSPDKALSRGSGYWCSEGNHRKEDIITWTGRLKTRRSVEGVEINWAYAPGKGEKLQKETNFPLLFF